MLSLHVVACPHCMLSLHALTACSHCMLSLHALTACSHCMLLQQPSTTSETCNIPDTLCSNIGCCRLCESGAALPAPLTFLPPGLMRTLFFGMLYVKNALKVESVCLILLCSIWMGGCMNNGTGSHPHACPFHQVVKQAPPIRQASLVCRSSMEGHVL